MANTFKNATLAVPATLTALYTCPASTSSVVHSLYFSNIDGAATVTIDIVLYDSSKTTEYKIGENLPIPIGATLFFEKPINLEDSDELRISADDVNNVEAIASILEIT